ncbi:hypothetical protein [Litorihabitans aurantiacus]|uniref:Uncharacterized protein n=1 Tax=Litorihabitans aurantiacus TaxID=1930061 RepID=A0AA37UH02_9MICO|nr:hypothetical protein [Litorihabitans aurantiacus]GMA30264.1 hypothetical protein GCM10025875_02560 [Litorihabitans aurantiacus]
MRTLIGASTRAVVSSLATALLAVAALLAWEAALAVLALLVAIFAWGWPQLLALPAFTGTRVLLALVAAASFAAVTLTGDIRLLTLVAALGVVAAFVREFARRDGRPRLIESLAASAAGIAVVVSAAGWVAVGESPTSLTVVLTAAVALAAGSACAAIHLPPWPHALLTIAAATGVGIGGGYFLPEVGYVVSGLLGLSAGLLSAALHALLGRYPSAGRPAAALAAAVLPVAVVGIPVYVLLRFYLV